MKKIILISSVFAILVISAGSLFAQGPPLPPAPPSTAVPIDGGLSIIIAGCAAYGAKKIYKNKQAQKQNNINE
jgi:hypothetical protein